MKLFHYIQRSVAQMKNLDLVYSMLHHELVMRWHKVQFFVENFVAKKVIFYIN